MFRTDSLLCHVGQILTVDYPKSDWKWWFPTIIWKSIHTIQFKLGVYTYSVSECFWAMLAKFWPLTTHKMTENGGFRPLSEKLFMQSHSNLVCTHTYWVSAQNCFTFGPRWPNFSPLVATKCLENGGFRPLSEKVFMQSNSNLVCTLIKLRNIHPEFNQSTEQDKFVFLMIQPIDKFLHGLANLSTLHSRYEINNEYNRPIDLSVNGQNYLIVELAEFKWKL